MNYKTNPSIYRFCRVITEINDLTAKLDKARTEFYDGGMPFESIYMLDLNQLIKLENEFLDLHYSIAIDNGII